MPWPCFLLEAELALTLTVLETVADSSLEDILDQPLHTLSYIHSKIQGCVQAQPKAGPRATSSTGYTNSRSP
ncbi:hypothetical protein CB1_000338037 [Camelus ferus]|nr:hypothetical protein CB1_000338037 [Camelus ferus]